VSTGASGPGPLHARTIAVTRPRAQGEELAEALRRLGATVIVGPAVKVIDAPDLGPLDRALDDLATYDWLVVTSANTIPRVLARMRARGQDPALLAARLVTGMRIAAVGPTTAASLAAVGLKAVALPKDFRAEGLAAVLAAYELRGKAVFFPRALEARDLLPDALRDCGARVDVAPVYRTVPWLEGVAPIRAAIRAGQLDIVTLTSGAIAQAFLAAFAGSDGGLGGVPLASIGPVTSAAIRALGHEPTVEARTATTAGLVAALVEHFAGPVVDPADLETGDDT